jgi:hypothetical protein
MLEVNFNLFKKKDGYKLTVAAMEDDKVLYEEELEDVKGLRKNAIIMRKKHITLNGKVLTLGLNIFNDKGNNKSK